MFLKINKISTKLLLFSLTLVMFAGAIVVVFTVYIERMKAYNDLRNQVDELLILNPKRIKAEQDFLLHDWQDTEFMTTGESPSLHEYGKNTRKIRYLIDEILKNPLSGRIQVKPKLQEIQQLNQKHHQIFNELVDKIKQRGFKDLGLEGKMRRAVHTLQAIDTLNQEALLTLRRYEKDFIIRKDLIYVDSLKKAAEKLVKITGVKVKSFDRVSMAKLANVILIVKQYIRQFDRIVQLETEIGLTETTGLKGNLQQTAQVIDNELINIDKLIDKNTQTLDENSNWVIRAFLVSIFVIVIVIGVYFAYWLSRPIVALDRIAKSVTQGLRNQEVFLDRIQRNDEIGSLAKNFKLMLLKLKNTIYQANEKNRQLAEFSQTEARRSWFNEGLSIFSELTRKHHINLAKLSDEVVSELVKYTKSSQGGIFIVNREEGFSNYLELKGCYAYERKRFQQKNIELGEGLIGTTWQTGKMIYAIDIPEDYAFIRSGLGKAKPKSLLIVPIKSDDAIEGVIELISLNEFSELERNFVEAIAERVATSIITIKANEQTQKLLEISETLAQQAQEKEARLQKQIADYQHWIREFELKVNTLAEEALIYHAILGKVYSGFVITDEQFRINKINPYAAKRFGYVRTELEGRPLDLFIETDYSQIVDLRDKKYRLNGKAFHEPIFSRVRDKDGNFYEVEAVSGKIEIDTQIVYVFLFNELSEAAKSSQSREVNLKVAS
jgi:PAS domain S-box-containing protein